MLHIVLYVLHLKVTHFKHPDILYFYATICLNALSNALYLSLLSECNNVFHGVYSRKPSTPFSQNTFKSAGLNPDIIDTFWSVERAGNPVVFRKFQNIICGALIGSPYKRSPIFANICLIFSNSVALLDKTPILYDALFICISENTTNTNFSATSRGNLLSSIPCRIRSIAK